MKRPARSPSIDRPAATEISPDDAANAAMIATWPSDRPAILRLLQCRLLHQADWQHLGTRQDQSRPPWSIDTYRCERCERAWDSLSESQS